MAWGEQPKPQVAATQEIQDLLAKWFIAQDDLLKAKLEEIKLRNQAVKALFPNPEEGVNNFTLPDGFIAKASFPVSLKLKATDDQLDMVRLRFNQAGEAGKLLIGRLLKAKIEISKTEYDKLDETPGGEQYKEILKPFVTKKKGQPQFKIVEPGETDAEETDE